MKLKLVIVMLFLASGIYASSANAATINAASCSQADVQAAIGSASAGDVVVVPAGSCNWASSISIPTGVTLQGAGIGQTVISGNGATLNSNSRLTGFEFATDVDLSVVPSAQGWRIDHNKLPQSTGDIWILIRGNCGVDKIHPGGLIDNNIILNGAVGVFGCSDIYSDVLWYTGWREYNDPAEKIYFEDNTVTNSAGMGRIIDANYSGRYVARYNTITDGYFEAHGARDSRGTQSFEIYENSITNNATPYVAVMAGNIRGGSGVIFNNDCSGVHDRCDWTFKTERCCTAYPPYPYSGKCDGTSAWDTSPHPATSTNYLCRDSFAGKDASLGAGVIDQPPDSQESLPGYMWGNTENGVSTWNMFVDGGCEFQIIKEDRDFYMDDSSASGFGNGGVVIGTLANRPASCTPYEGYWATDAGEWNSLNPGPDGQLYKCTAPDTWSLYYIPYTYPHPLSQTALTGDLNSDSQVNITDIQACVNHILGTQDWGAAADVNGDTSVNVLDVQEIVNLILGG